MASQIEIRYLHAHRPGDAFLYQLPENWQDAIPPDLVLPMTSMPVQKIAEAILAVTAGLTALSDPTMTHTYRVDFQLGYIPKEPVKKKIKKGEVAEPQDKKYEREYGPIPKAILDSLGTVVAGLAKKKSFKPVVVIVPLDEESKTIQVHISPAK